MTRDADGFYYHAGREDDLFKVAGLWVVPGDVEAVLLGHPGVAEQAWARRPAAPWLPDDPAQGGRRRGRDGTGEGRAELARPPLTALSIIRRLARNEAWANLRLHDAVGGLDTAAYHRAGRTSFFPSIHLTLSHILHVGLYYADGVMEGGRGRAVWEENDRFDREGTFGELRTAQAALDRALVAWVDALPEDRALDREVPLPRRDHTPVDRAGDILLHLFEHQIHHRGQVHAMLSGTDIPPPQLDEFFLRGDRPGRVEVLHRLGIADAE
jgi:uncharacterized damage-inducible protein DinB